MIDGKFDVVFRGQVVRGMDESVVKTNLVALFKSSPEAVEKLFTGNEVVVRKDLDYGTAMKYQSALKKAGALALIKEIEQKPIAAQPSQGKASFGVRTSDDSAPSADVNSPQTNQQDSVDVEKTAETEVDSSVKSESTVNQSIADNDSDSSQDSLTVAEPGAQILPDKIYEKREVDTSQLSLASAGERILPEKAPESHPQPSIDHLKLEE